MGCPLSKSSASDNPNDRIRKLSQLSSGSGEVMFSASGYELLLEQTVMWEIDNFAIGPQRGRRWSHSLSIDMGGKKKLNVKGAIWTFCLSEKSKSRKSANPEDEEVLACRATYQDGEQFKTKDMFYSVKATIHGAERKETFQSPFKAFLEECEIFRMGKGSLVDRHLSNTGSLITEIALQVFRTRPPVVTQKCIADQSGLKNVTKSISCSKTSLGQFMGSKQFSDVKIYSSDGKIFDAHKIFLCAGSEVFSAMFKAGMTEANTGVIKLHDMSSTGVRFLLSYMYGCNVLPYSVNGKKVEGIYKDPEHGFGTSEKALLTANEVLYIASKYGLGGVLEHVDQIFRRECTEDNAASLFEMSKMHHLDCKEFLKDFIKRHSRALDAHMER